MLSYKLGKLMIQESKSLKDYIKLPFKLLNYAKIHKKEQEFYEMSLSLNPSLKRLSLEEYSDHDKALRYKEHLSYKLGESLIKAYNNKWGGVIQIYHHRFA